jgi:outer membrane protein assembly factor BamD (BamD/ComL family)/cell division protein FtsB
MKTKMLTVIFLMAGVGVLSAANLEADRILGEGLAYFRDSQFQAAVDKFALITGSQYMKEYHGVAYFMMGKSYFAMNKLKEASGNIEFYLANFKDHPYYAEAYYLKGSVLFKQGDFDNAILVSEDFIARYPGSQFVPNAYFLIGECLYNKGQLDRAEEFYRVILNRYPASAKIEAAQYRASLIGFKKREGELLKLLKWSYEDSLQAIGEYKRREKTYEQAIVAYQKKIAEGGYAGGDDVKNLEVKLAEKDLEIQSLRTDNTSLQREVSLLKDQLAAARSTTSPAVADEFAESLQEKQEMLEMKERALLVKEEYLKWLKTYLESK